MHNSGTKLVLAVTTLALLLGATSWWYRYEAAHRASQFWGPEASRLIAESESVEAITHKSESDGNVATLVPGALAISTDLSKARGQAHLRHALMSDRNYLWEVPLDSSTIAWRWTLRFHEGERQTLVKLSDDLTAIGKVDAAHAVTAISCEPMAASLKQHFGALGLLAKPQAGASTVSE